MLFNEEAVAATEEGENYFVSMTDMMVGMLFIFIIMLMTFALNYRQREDVSSDQIEKLKQAVLVVDHKVDDLKQIFETRSNFLIQLEGELTKRGVDVKIDPASGVLRLPEAILFTSNAILLSPKGKENIRTLGDVLAGILPCYLSESSVRPLKCPATRGVSLESVFIEGHADATGGKNKIGEDLNWALSVNRAIATYRELEKNPARVTDLDNDSQQKLFSVSGYGQFRPVPNKLDPKDFSQDRRIELRFNMQIDQQQALEEIQTELKRITPVK